MKRSNLVASGVLAAFTPAVAQAQAPTPQHARQYEQAYRAVVVRFGHRTPGRNIVAWGWDAHHRASDAQVMWSLAILGRMLHPPVQTVSYTPASTSTQPVTSSYGGGSSGGLPSCTWVPESGGNWSAVNPSSGAGGRYQILPSTWAANGGTGAPQNASPAEQTAIATKIYAGGAGASQWVNC